MMLLEKILFKLFINKIKFNKMPKVNKQPKGLMNNLKKIFKKYLYKIMVKIV